MQVRLFQDRFPLFESLRKTLHQKLAQEPQPYKEETCDHAQSCQAQQEDQGTTAAPSSVFADGRTAQPAYSAKQASQVAHSRSAFPEWIQKTFVRITCPTHRFSPDLPIKYRMSL